MTALATRLPLESGRTWLGWILPGSVALHVLAIMVLPSAPRAPGAPAPLVIEMADPPPPEPPAPPPPPPEEPAPEPAPLTAPPVARSAPAPRRAPASRQSQAATDRPADESPVDFSSAVMSNDGPGMTMRGSAGGARGSSREGGRAVTAPGVRSGPPAEPRIVAVKDLARRPRAPGLDAALEQHYPAEARRSGISGKAVLRVRILPDGRIGKVQRIEETRSGFAEACEKAVRSAAWEPPLDREGAPVATEITYTCRFEIRG